MNSTTEQSTKEQKPLHLQKNRDWRRRWATGPGRGAIAMVAEKHDCSPSMVSQVLHGKKTSPEISKDLDRMIRITKGADRNAQSAETSPRTHAA